MNDILNWFIDFFKADDYQELPDELAGKLNELNRVERGELKMKLFNEAKILARECDDPVKPIRWLENSFELIEQNTFRLHEVLLSPGKQIPDTLNVLLNNARYSISVCVFTISDRELSRRLLEANRRGVDVRVISDDQKVHDRGSQVYNLKRAGVKVKIDHSRYHMHNKFGIVDNRIAFTGSYNWTYTANKHNQENLIVTTNFDIVRQFAEQFEKLWERMFWL
ncbi:MAG: DUF1669 domain-containing protein [Chlorobi bacterium]|nr:DUF1669 domain-containing protein [Chlorobiota bacterium]